MNEELARLQELYSESSKHSNYQILPESVANLLVNYSITVKSRFERERLSCILSHIDPKGKCVLDIGGNTGFFSVEILDKGAKRVAYFEGNKSHADFVSLATSILGYSKKIKIYNRYYSFTEDKFTYDIALLLNVLHHVGDDYGNTDSSIEDAKRLILSQLNFMAYRAKVIVFQLGFCWKGNQDLLLFKNGTKSEMIDFIVEGSKDYWTV
ncbi:MAG TPA: hypothetical protein VHA52_09630, partial [Candidatus Babeliaceae bacterium]|nr:hypothetical protein [Candidatus Babeliaceae bacterium]